jgi:formiminoglutamate deiminase
LLRTVYARAGAGRPAEGAQLRFVDPSVDLVLRDLDTLRARYAGDPDVRIGVAPHSTRAVPPEWLREIAAYAAKYDLPVHAHVAEQEREIAECLAETGYRPVELFAEQGLLSPRFVAVHATNLAPHEATLLGRAGGFVCLCATTERDLGDGLPDTSALRAAQVRLCTGVDSHVITDPLEELRAIETHERLRLRTRVTTRANPGDPTLARRLWEEGSTLGAQALGFEDAGGELWLPKDAPELLLVADDLLLDAVVFGGTARLLGAGKLVTSPAE